MMKSFTTVLLTAFVGLVLTSNVMAQRNCGSMELLELQMEQQPALFQNIQDIERFTQDYIANRPGEARGTVYTIPVVVHVVWKTNSQNISDAQIYSQMAVLNEDFRRLNSDADGTWPQGSDVEIEFCMATQDPDGAATNGIERRKTNKRSFGYNNDGVKFYSMGGLDAWPAGDYMNLWVCNLSNGLLGYAQFPGGNPATDGVVIDYAYFGSGGSAQAPFDLGRTATHEVGHWLNLRHIWGDGGCSVDDFVSDTPLSDGANYGCAVGHVSCSTTDMVQNYMDYSDDDCMNLFTTDQGTRMRALFSGGGARASLVNSPGCSGGNPPTCTDGIQNGNETGVDCGGDCPNACPATCSDGIMNGTETGIDCGGNCDPCSSGSCDAPTGLVATNIKPKRAKLNWSAVSAASSYNVQIQAVGGSWQTFSTSNTNMTISGLSNGTTYEWQVQAVCGGSSSVYSSPVCSFTAGQSNSGACGSNRFATQEDVFNIYPNPASSVVFLSANLELENTVTVYVQDVYGKIVSANTFDNLEKQSIEVDGLAPGIYLMRIDLGEGNQQIKKFMIAR